MEIHQQHLKVFRKLCARQTRRCCCHRHQDRNTKVACSWRKVDGEDRTFALALSPASESRWKTGIYGETASDCERIKRLAEVPRPENKWNISKIQHLCELSQCIRLARQSDSLPNLTTVKYFIHPLDDQPQNKATVSRKQQTKHEGSWESHHPCSSSLCSPKNRSWIRCESHPSYFYKTL